MTVSILQRENKPNLAYVLSEAAADGAHLPLVMFCGGYKSDMNGTKATYLESACQQRGQAYLRFDYSGHGESDGAFEAGTIGGWLGDALDVYDAAGRGRPVILVGSSMGGWIALLFAVSRVGSVKGLIGIAAAPDFTKNLWDNELTPQQRDIITQKGRLEIPNDYSDEPYIFTKKLFDDAQNHMLLDEKHNIEAPMRLIQGMKDADVPWQTAVRIQDAFMGDDVETIFVDDGDHRLSRPEDLELLFKEVVALSEKAKS